MTAQVWWPKERTDRLNELTLLGWSSGKIAQELGVTRNAIIGKWHRSGIRKQCADLMPDKKIAVVRKERARTGWRVRYREAREIKTELPRQRFPKPTEQPAPVSLNPKRLVALKNGDCRFPISPHFSRDHMFCGNPKLEPHSYCAGHLWIAHNRKPEGKAGRMVLSLLGTARA